MQGAPSCVLFIVALTILSYASAQNSAGKPRYTIPEEHMNLLLEMVRMESKQNSQTCVGPGKPGIFTPPGVARAYHLLATAMYNAWAPFSQYSKPTVSLDLPRLTPSTLATRGEAITHAAYRMLSFLLPERVRLLNLEELFYAKYKINVTVVSEDPRSPSFVAKLLTEALIEKALTDGSNQQGCYADTSNFVSPNLPTVLDSLESVSAARNRSRNPFSYSQEVRSGYINQPRAFLMPHAGRMKAFAITPSQPPFQAPPLPPAEEYHNYFLELIEIQKKLEDNNGRLKLIAEYWADGPKSSLPPGHWIQITIDMLRRTRSTMKRAITALFIVSTTTYDAAISCWTEKKHYLSVRPSTYIPTFTGLTTQLEKQYVGPYCPLSDIQAWQWKPYQQESFITPPFSEYTSGHTTFSFAAAKALTLIFGSPNVPPALDGSEGISVVIPKGESLFEAQCFFNNTNLRGLPCNYRSCIADESYDSENYYWPAVDVTLGPWYTFEEAAESAGLSRLYGGIHIAPSNIQAKRIGMEVGKAVYQKAMSLVFPRPIQ